MKLLIAFGQRQNKMADVWLAALYKNKTLISDIFGCSHHHFVVFSSGGYPFDIINIFLTSQWSKSPKKKNSLKECVFVYSALKHIVKNTLYRLF